MFESFPGDRKTVLILILNENDEELLKECGFLKTDINRLNEEFKTILMQQK